MPERNRLIAGIVLDHPAIRNVFDDNRIAEPTAHCATEPATVARSRGLAMQAIQKYFA
ncbi:hypothetical protein [Candidimonas nitroreducens]|uniref:hypothetical protein n=1 Tax=Candidimonas nitroreducens TaxID=683354 RepID=UPI001303EA95|nr:hypothetical protein [Candidimonas nitroreducens]